MYRNIQIERISRYIDISGWQGRYYGEVRTARGETDLSDHSAHSHSAHRSLLSDVTKSKQIPNTTNVNTYISTLKTMRNVPLGSESLSPQSDITANNTKYSKYKYKYTRLLNKNIFAVRCHYCKRKVQKLARRKNTTNKHKQKDEKWSICPLCLQPLSSHSAIFCKRASAINRNKTIKDGGISPLTI